MARKPKLVLVHTEKVGPVEFRVWWPAQAAKQAASFLARGGIVRAD